MSARKLVSASLLRDCTISIITDNGDNPKKLPYMLMTFEQAVMHCLFNGDGSLKMQIGELEVIIKTPYEISPGRIKRRKMDVDNTSADDDT